MTVQEAIKYLRMATDEAEWYCDEYREMCEMSIQALEKQIPKKVVEIRIPNTTFSKAQTRYVCPVCRKAYEGTDYCPSCGQALDWEEGAE